MGDYERRRQEEEDARQRRKENDERLNRITQAADAVAGKAAQDAASEAQMERIALLGASMVEALLGGRAAISITREPTGETDPDSHDPVMKTLIRLVVDPGQ